jgi:LppX/LprAFG-like lipoprotein
MKLRTPLSLAALAAAGAVAIAACGGSSSPSSSNTGTGGSNLAGLSPQAALIKAASNAGSEAGAKIQFSANIASSEGHFTIHGTGEFNKSPEAVAAQIDAGGLPEVGSLTLNVIFANGIAYIKIPSNLPAAESAEFGAFLHGKSWIEIDTKSLAHAGSSLGALAAGSSSFNSTELLKVLDSATHVSKVGSATVNGVATTEYRATIDTAKLSTATASKELPSAVPVTIWIDGSGSVRQVSVAVNSAGAGGSFTVDLLSYGAQQVPAPPSSSETLNLSSLLSGHGL